MCLLRSEESMEAELWQMLFSSANFLNIFMWFNHLSQHSEENSEHTEETERATVSIL